MTMIRGRLFRLLSQSPASHATNVEELSIHEFLDDYISKKPLVILGEYHGSKATIQLQTAIQEAMAHSTTSTLSSSSSITSSLSKPVMPEVRAPKVRVIMEHFSVDMQPLLHRYQNIHTNNSNSNDDNEYSNKDMSTEELIHKYHRIGTEQHNLEPYIPLLESAKNSANKSIILHGGFVPRSFARQLHSLVKNYMSNQQSQSKENNEIKSSTQDNDHHAVNVLQDNGIAEFIQQMKDLNYISPTETLLGSEEHYNYFESLFTQRNIHTTIPQQQQSQQQMPNPRFRSLFPAQILKDASMAWTVQSILSNSAAKNINTTSANGTHNDHDDNIHENDKLFIICGVGHMLYSHGVPERIQEKGDMLRIACLPVSKGTFGNNMSSSSSSSSSCPHHHHEVDADMISSIIQDEYGTADAADICFIYEEEDDEEEEEEETIVVTDKMHHHHHNHEEKDEKMDHYYIQQETKNVYDKVGSTASNLQEGNLVKAHDMLSSLNYTQEEIDFVGLDAVNYQGVGCPHRHANIQKGERVLDMGSGLGVDSIIATKAVGEDGVVVGVDISSQCVNHANRRAKARGAENMLSFLHSPIEEVGTKIKMNNTNDTASKSTIDNNTDDKHKPFDVIISNGAFCLLPDKKRGFAECFNLLKNGGRVAICTTVIKDTLKKDIDWPLCMQTFAKMDEIEPMLQELGFVDIDIDLSDSLMEIESTIEEGDDNNVDIDDDSPIEEDDEEGQDSTRYKVHNEEGRKRYSHLEKFDMNELCARVVIKARKP